MLMIESTIEKMNACQKPAIENPGTMYAANNTSPAFIISAKNPNVMKVSGRAIIEIIGRTSKFIIASTIAKINIDMIVVCTPGTIYATTPIETAASIH